MAGERTHSEATDPDAPVAIITGATSGIGLEVARGLASRGTRTVLVGRGGARVAAAARSVQEVASGAGVEAVAVPDLAVLADVRALATDLLARYPEIRVLVNNAGGMFVRREVTREGLERTFALNVLSPLLLTSLLAPRLIESAPARVVNVASAAHRGASVNWGNLQGEEGYRGYGAYARSKLELILLTRELARKFEGTDVAVNAVHPGFVRTKFALNNGGGTAAAFRVLFVLFGQTPRRGAETPLFVATDPSVGGISGQYFSRSRVSPGSPPSRNGEDAQRLYEICRKLTNAPPIPPAHPVD